MAVIISAYFKKMKREFVNISEFPIAQLESIVDSLALS